MKKFLGIMSCIFGVLTIILYCISIQKVDSSTARILGTSEVINIQATVFCAASAVLCVINFVGAFILSSHENLESLMRETHKDIEKSFDMAPATQKNALSEAISPETNLYTEMKHTAKKSENPDWIDDGENFVKCPQCGERMSIDYITARKKCPHCGCVYKS